MKKEEDNLQDTRPETTDRGKRKVEEEEIPRPQEQLLKHASHSAGQAGPSENAESSSIHTIEMWIPKAKVGYVIGRKGKCLKEIQSSSNADVKIDGKLSKATIKGTAEQIETAKKEINKKIVQCPIRPYQQPAIIPTIGSGSFFPQSAAQYQQPSMIPPLGPRSSASQPAAQYQQPAAQYQQPAPQYQQPAPQYQQRAAQYQQQAAHYQQPPAHYQQQARFPALELGSFPRPTAQHQQPSAQYQQPAAWHQQPAAWHQQPAAWHQQPAARYQQPAARYQQPAARYQQPAARYQHPAMIPRPSDISHYHIPPAVQYHPENPVPRLATPLPYPSHPYHTPYRGFYNPEH